MSDSSDAESHPFRRGAHPLAEQPAIDQHVQQQAAQGLYMTLAMDTIGIIMAGSGAWGAGTGGEHDARRNSFFGEHAPALC